MLTQNLGHPRIGATRKLKTFSDLYSSGTGKELYQSQFQQRKIHFPIQTDCPNGTFTRTCILLSAASPDLSGAEGTVLKAEIMAPKVIDFKHRSTENIHLYTPASRELFLLKIKQRHNCALASFASFFAKPSTTNRLRLSDRISAVADIIVAVFPHDISSPQQTILCWLEHLTFPNQINRGHFPSAR